VRAAHSQSALTAARRSRSALRGVLTVKADERMATRPALHQLPSTGIMTLHKNLDVTVEKRGLHREASGSPRSGGVHGGRWQLDRERRLRGVLQLHEELTSMRQRFEKDCAHWREVAASARSRIALAVVVLKQ
jgi:hypothetical protein